MLEGAESIMSFQVRTERAKERNPDTVDAVRRISGEVLTTVAACPSAILRATMIDEAAKLLDLPRVALAEELEKIKSAPAPIKTAVNKTPQAADEELEYVEEPEIPDEPIEGEAVPKALPPPSVEMAFMEFLLAHEETDDIGFISKMIGEFLPDMVFAHAFTVNFVNVWRTQVDSDQDMIAPWCDALESRERAWFDAILVNHTHSLESNLSGTQIAQEFIRALWTAYLKRLRGNLPAVGDSEADLKRMKITLDLKHLNSVKWSSVKDLIRDWMK